MAAPEASRILHVHAAPPFHTNNYIINGNTPNEVVIIDCGDASETLIDYLTANHWSPLAILVTHAHMDHISGISRVKQHFDIPIYVPELDQELYHNLPNQPAILGLPFTYPPPPKPDTVVTDGMGLTLAGLTFTVIHTPGHTPGSTCYLLEDALFTGDTLFAGSIGRTDLPGGSYPQILNSIHTRIVPLGDAVRVYPGHGPATTIGQERLRNPFLQVPYIPRF